MNKAIYHLIKQITRSQDDNIPKAYIMLFLPADPVIVDAGAHVGDDTRSLSYLWPAATIHAFEPVPALYQQIATNTRGLVNVHCYPLALAKRTGTADLYVSGGGGDASSSLLTPKEHLAVNPHVSFSETISVPTMTLDEWGNRQNCPRLDFLWLDMQGEELAMLQASPRLLSTVILIHLEVALVELYEKNPLYPEVRSWLESQGFRLEAEEIIPECSGNALFVRQEVSLRWDRVFYLMLRKAAAFLKLPQKAKIC